MDIRKNLRRAGDFLAKKDDQYSQLISDQYDRLPDNGIGRAVKGFGHTLGGGMPSLRGPLQPQAGDPAFTGVERMVAHAVPAINAVPKYVLPTTVAGIGLNAITNAFMAQTGGPADMQEPGQLDLSPIETVSAMALLGGGFGAAHGAARELGRKHAYEAAMRDQAYQSEADSYVEPVQLTIEGGPDPEPKAKSQPRLAASPEANALLMASTGAPDSRKTDYNRREFGSAKRPFNVR